MNKLRAFFILLFLYIPLIASLKTPVIGVCHMDASKTQQINSIKILKYSDSRYETPITKEEFEIAKFFLKKNKLNSHQVATIAIINSRFILDRVIHEHPNYSIYHTFSYVPMTKKNSENKSRRKSIICLYEKK